MPDPYDFCFAFHFFPQTDYIMPVSYIIHRVRSGLYYDMSQAIKYNHSLDLMTVLMVNLLFSLGTSALYDVFHQQCHEGHINLYRCH